MTMLITLSWRAIVTLWKRGKRKCFAAVVARALRHLRHEEDLVDSPDPAGMRADEKTSNHEKG